ncbi:MAG: leucine-rich repeat domain-containing protein [Muribaculaceae bacterium]|nr:leucine-rich repeat domain-containing protein [Muribaculaceae bacterium]
MKQVNLLRRVCVAMVMMVCVVYVAQAHDFEVDGIYYNITSETNKTVEVTYKGESYSTIIEYSGDIVVPENVSYNDTLYSVVSIGNHAFYNCGDMTSIAIPNSVTSIGKSAFYKCSSLVSITIPNLVTSIGESAFRHCSGLTSIEFNAENCAAVSNYVFDGCKALSSVIFGDKVKNIPNYVFYGCSSLTNVTISNSVTSIGQCAFMGCGGLTSVSIPNSVTSIGGSAFSGCSSLTNVTIPNSVASIGGSAFMECSGLTSIVIPNSVTSIGVRAFEDCTSLVSVEYNAENCTTMGSLTYHVFEGCTALSSVVIGDKVKNIPDYAFYKCSGLTSVTIGNSVESIGAYAFYDCSGLTSLVFPSTVASIGKYAFRGCTGLTSITSKNTTPPVCDMAAFKNVDVNIPLIVPQESVSRYKATYIWMNFLNIQGQDMSGVEDTFTDNGEVLMEVARYDANGRSISAPVKGVNIVRYSNGTVKKVLVK